MLADLRTLFWLQWKLTLGIFRGRQVGDRLRILGLLLRVVSVAFTLPLFVLMGFGVAVGLMLISAQAAFEVVTILNTFLFFVWLLLPASYSSQIIERFEMSRLFPHPLPFRSIVVGSTFVSLLTMTGLWTVPLILGEIVGLAFHRPLALPMILVGALPTALLLVLTGRIMEDFFDLVASDRRLRAFVIALLSLPFVFCWVGQYAIQYVTNDFSDLPALTNIPFLENLERLGGASGPSEALEILRLSRLLMWFPPGWTTAGMGLWATGAWGRALAFTLLSVLFVGVLLGVHALITRRLMEGAALTIGVERVRSRRWLLRLPGPKSFWTLFRKDWTYLRRSPMPRRLVFSALISIVALIFPLRSMGQSDAPAEIQALLPVAAAGGVITLLSMMMNLGLTANYFGVMDREGFGTLAHTPVDRRQVLLSSHLSVSLFVLPIYFILLVAMGILTRSWSVIPLGMYLGLTLQLGGVPAYTLAAVIGAYRMQLKFSGGRQRGNLWGMLAWIVSAPPVLALIVLPYILWKPALIVTLPLGLVYSLGIYILTLQPLARLLQRREHTILQAVSSD